MGYLHLVRNEYKLYVETSQEVLGQLVMNASEIVFFFEDHVQLWNIDTQKMVSESPTNGDMVFWASPVPLLDRSFAFVCLKNCEPYLATYSFTDNKVAKLCNLPKDQ
jgi:hypothetical protein